MFQRAQRKRVYLKIGIMGPSGAGKSYSALKLAEGLAEGGAVAAIDTENGSLSLYDNLTEFDVADIEPPFEPRKYIEAIQQAEQGGYKVLIIDSFSHAWKYLLNKKEDMDARGLAGDKRLKNAYSNWGPVKAEADELKDAILQSRIHIIACMRAKTEYAQEGGQVKKVGMAAIQEPDVEYEFTTVFDVAMDHKVLPSKDRTGLFGASAFKITAATGSKFLDWLNSAASQEAYVPPAKASEGTEGAAPAPVATNGQAPKHPGAVFLMGLKLTPDQGAEFKRVCTEAGFDAKETAKDIGEAGHVKDFEGLMSALDALINPPKGAVA